MFPSISHSSHSNINSWLNHINILIDIAMQISKKKIQHHMAPSLPRCTQPCFHQHGLHDHVARVRRQGHTEPPRRCARRTFRDGGSGDPGRPGSRGFLGGKMAGKMDENIPWRIHGAAIYGAPWIPSIYPISVSIYTSTMDPSWAWMK